MNIVDIMLKVKNPIKKLRMFFSKRYVIKVANIDASKILYS